MSERAGKTPDLSKAAATPHAVAEPKQHAQSDKDGSRAILKLQRAAGNAAVQVLLGTGMPLPSTVRGEMESRFGADFGGVRIHDDKQAHTAAARHEATAFTYGKDIFFGADRFAPDSVEGRRLLAHELAHVIQQRRGGAAPTGDANESTEQAAKQAAAAFSDGHGRIDVVGATSVGIAREEDDNCDWPLHSRILLHRAACRLRVPPRSHCRRP